MATAVNGFVYLEPISGKVVYEQLPFTPLAVNVSELCRYEAA